jgi:hypothetical protein
MTRRPKFLSSQAGNPNPIPCLLAAELVFSGIKYVSLVVRVSERVFLFIALKRTLQNKYRLRFILK